MLANYHSQRFAVNSRLHVFLFVPINSPMPFKNMLPMDPGPKGKFSSTREGETIAALAESRGVLANLKAFLAPFTPRFITDSTTGMKYEVLARPAGAEMW